MQTDEQLVAASLEGSDTAFDELVLRYRERLMRFLLTRSSSREDAEDAIQDTFISAYRYLYSFNPRWRFSTWIYRIALRETARQARQPESHSADLDQVATDKEDPLKACLAASERDNIWLTAKQVLPNDTYTAMWLRYVEDMPVKDVARSLDKSLSWAKVNLLRGRRRLETAMVAEEPAARSESYG